ncbi:MAG: hypothetical protein JO281_17325 [Pseudonocardiales bacterium]|nr:hypothetical protein [Pseudonocardiales bacterium]
MTRDAQRARIGRGLPGLLPALVGVSDTVLGVSDMVPPPLRAVLGDPPAGSGG